MDGHSGIEQGGLTGSAQIMKSNPRILFASMLLELFGETGRVVGSGEIVSNRGRKHQGLCRQLYQPQIDLPTASSIASSVRTGTRAPNKRLFKELQKILATPD